MVRESTIVGNENKEALEKRKQQIIQEINNTKRQIENLNGKRVTYIENHKALTDVSTELLLAKESLLIAKEELEEAYNGESCLNIKNKITTDLDNINEELITLNNVIIPGIDDEIEKIDKEIQQKNNNILRLEIELKKYILQQ